MTNLPIPLPLPQAPTLADVYRATHRERFTRVPDWWPFGKHFAPETGYADIEDQWWLSFNTNLREMFELFKNSYREYSRSSIFSRWMHEDQFNKDPQVVAAMRGNDFAAWLRATGNVRMNAFESCAWAPTKGARSEEARRNHIASEAAYHKLHDQHKAERYNIVTDISPWYNADFVRRAVPLYILKTFGLPISDVQPTGPFVYATVFLADVGMIGTPWLYIGKRMDPSDQSYLGSGRRLRECIEEMGEIMFVRYTVVSLPLGSTSGDLESAEASVLRRFQAAKDKRLFNIINS